MCLTCQMCISQTAVHMFLIPKNLKPVLFLSFMPSSQHLLLCPSVSIILSVLFYKMAAELLFFSCDVESASLLLNSFPLLPSLSLHLSLTLPFSFSFLSPSSVFATTPQSIPFTSCPLPSLLFSMFLFFFLRLH